MAERADPAPKAASRRTHGIYVGATAKGRTWEQARDQCRHNLLVVALFHVPTPTPDAPTDAPADAPTTTTDVHVVLVFRRIHEWLLPVGWVPNRALLGVFGPRDKAKPEAIAAFARLAGVRIHAVGAPFEVAAALSLPLQTISQVNRDIDAHKPVFDQAVKRMRELEALKRILERREGTVPDEVLWYGAIHTSESLRRQDPRHAPSSSAIPIPPLPHHCMLPYAPQNVAYARRLLRAQMSDRIVPRDQRLCLFTNDASGEAMRWWHPWAKRFACIPTDTPDDEIRRLALAARASGDFDVVILDLVTRCMPVEGLEDVACQLLMGCAQEQAVREFVVFSERARASAAVRDTSMSCTPPLPHERDAAVDPFAALFEGDASLLLDVGLEGEPQSETM